MQIDSICIEECKWKILNRTCIYDCIDAQESTSSLKDHVNLYSYFAKKKNISYMLWHIELKFWLWLYISVLQIKFEYSLFLSIFVRVMQLFELTILEIHIFPHFSSIWFDILSWNFYMTLFYWTTDQVRVSSIFVGVLRLLELGILKIDRCRTFLLYLTYWAEIWHMTFFLWTLDQVSVITLGNV